MYRATPKKPKKPTMPENPASPDKPNNRSKPGLKPRNPRQPRNPRKPNQPREPRRAYRWASEELYVVAMSSRLLCGLSLSRPDHPCKPAEVEQPYRQEEQRHAQPQTATLPGWSRPAQSRCKRLASTAHDSFPQTVEFQRTEQRERGPDESRWEPVSKRDHGCASEYSATRTSTKFITPWMPSSRRTMVCTICLR